MQVPQHIWKKVNRLSRQRIQVLLESTGTAVYDDESIKDLRECLVEQWVAGDIDEEDLQE